jgi:DNA invertase Pin-like site-specific DNA recombinase
MHVAGYIRVSTEQQKEEGSHENQRERLADWADREGHEITFYEDIAISGQADERESYELLLEDAEQFDAIVVRELSRFGRNLQRMLNDIRDLKERGVDFISLKDNIDMTTAQGKLMMQIIGAFNEFWANIARERANEMVQRRREEGKPIGRPKKLSDEQIEEVRDWNEKGLNYSSIATLIEDAYGVEVSRQTIYRYCNGN